MDSRLSAFAALPASPRNDTTVDARRGSTRRTAFATQFLSKKGSADGALQRGGPFGIAHLRLSQAAIPFFGRGCSSGVEHNLAKVGVEGSNPFARSKIYRSVTDTWVTVYSGDMGNTLPPKDSPILQFPFDQPAIGSYLSN